MEAFCHQLSKPAGSLLVKTEDNFLDLTIIYRDKVFLAGVSLDANPQAKQLLEPCDNVEVVLQRHKVTVLVNGDDVIRNTTLEQSESREALVRVTKLFSELSRKHAETIRKAQDAKDVRNEAFECLKKIEEQHQQDFTKFILILNEKKKKIRELQRKLGIRTEDPEDIEDDIGVEVISDNPSQSKKSKISDQLALEGPPASTSQTKAQSEEVDENTDGEVGEADDAEDEDLLSDEELSDRARSEVEETEEDEPPIPEVASMSSEKQEAGGEGKETGAIKEEIKEENMSLGEDKESETDHCSRGRDLARSTRKKTSPKKSSLDILDDLL